MNSSLNFIDDYFTGVLNNEERRAFEERCIADETFAKEVAEYISVRDALSAHVRQQKKNEFAELYKQSSADKKQSKIILFKRIAYLAAASVLVIIGWLLFLQKASPQKTAEKYIAENLGVIGLNMGKSDSLQAGITAYNSKLYTRAEMIFKPLADVPETAPEAVKYLGLTHLLMKQYDEALKDFDNLSAMHLYINPGKFYKAVTLMERSQTTDALEAKKILQEIISKNLYGNQEARNWIKQLKN